MPTTKKVIRINKAQCSKCKDIIESKHVHDFRFCKCEAIFVDGGKEYLRRGGDLDLIIDLSVEETVPMTPLEQANYNRIFDRAEEINKDPFYKKTAGELNALLDLKSVDQAQSIGKVLNEAVHKNDHKGVKFYVQERGTCDDHYGTMVFSLESQEKGIQNKLGMDAYKTLIEKGEYSYNRPDAEVKIELVDSSRIDMW